MTRALYVTCLSLALAVFGATADAKPKVAVLGLEVTSPDNGSVDQQTTAAANNLTVALRDRVRSGSGPYDTAPGSDKELIDLKLLNDCQNEGLGCLVKIGNDLGASAMLYGHLSKQGGSYHVTVSLLNVEGKAKGLSKGYDIPVTDLASGPKGNETLVWARKIYSEMTGTSQGTVIVRVSGADHGTLYVEESGVWQPKGSITSGQGRTSLPEGKYKIGVESEGFQRFESTVTVTAGADQTVPVTLVPMPRVDPGMGGNGSDTGLGTGSDHIYGGTVSETSNRTGWKVTAFTTAALAAGAGVYWYVERSSKDITAYDATNGNIVMPGTTMPQTVGGKTVVWDSSECGNSPGSSTTGDNNLYKKACDAHSREVIAGAAGIGLVAISAGLFYLAFRSDGEHAPPGAVVGRKHRTKPTIAFIPTMTPTGAGATFRLDW